MATELAAERCVLGVDVGGTFTDLTLIRLSDGKVFYHKTPSRRCQTNWA